MIFEAKQCLDDLSEEGSFLPVSPCFTLIVLLYACCELLRSAKGVATVTEKAGAPKNGT